MKCDKIKDGGDKMGTLDLIDAYTDIVNKLATMKLREAFDIAEAEEELGITVNDYNYMGILVRFAIKLLDNEIEHDEIIDNIKNTYNISEALANKAFKIAEVIRRERE